MGLRNGDIVQQVDDEPVESIDDAIEALKNIEVDYSAQISILRSGQPRQLVFKLNANGEE